MKHFVNVVVDNKSEQTDGFYTYAASEALPIGARLSLSFGKGKKPVDAYVVESEVKPCCEESRIKEVSEYIPERSLSEEMISTALWMRKRYGVKYIDAIKMFSVPGKRYKEEEETASEGVKPDYELTAEQRAAADRIIESVEAEEFKSFLIKGVTNSGKTEVYMSVVESVLSKGKTAIVLLPEIALAKQVEARFAKRFGKSCVATLHSKLSTSKRLKEWMRIRSGQARIVVGARTSVFAPLENIGAIIIDEEHEGTYKSDHNPKYETVDVAYKRAQEQDAVLVLGSATPSVSSYKRSQDGIYELIEMNHRVGKSEEPDIEIVDMKEEMRKGNLGLISQTLGAYIFDSLVKKEQIILFLNRRGYSTQILCSKCGTMLTCKDCGISLTYHKAENAAVCHYCGRKYPLPKSCEECGSELIKYTGAGTEKVVEEVERIWPEATVDRFDIDTAKSEKEIQNTLDAFVKGKTDILVGTQLLAKGLDFQNVGLVGIINADVSLNIPDYRSQERTYQLITQVAGRAGRAGGKSRVVIQTFEPDSEIMKNASNGDYLAFYEDEMLHRNIMNYPPYSDIILVTFTDKDENSSFAMEYAKAFRDRLKNLKDAPQGVVILPPREDYRRTDSKFRASFLIKAPSGSRAGYIKAYMELRDSMIRNASPCYVELDVNPYGIS